MTPADDAAWTNPSVALLAGSRDPVEAIVETARGRLLQAIDAGWNPPPYDPFGLAEALSIPLRPITFGGDARTVPDDSSPVGVRIEYDPGRPNGRLRFSLAHEIGHTLFPDVADQVRHRTRQGAVATFAGPDDWQLELLCNVAAGEFLMPAQTLEDLRVEDLNIDHVMQRQRELQVSTEALLRRLIFLTETPATMFAARQRDGAGNYGIDYAETGRRGGPAVRRGSAPPHDSVLAACTGVGFTARAQERWEGVEEPLLVQAVGIPPYPGHRLPRAAGIVVALSGDSLFNGGASLREVTGSALDPADPAKAILLHVVNDRAHAWAGPFGRSLSRKFPWAASAFRNWSIASDDNLMLGNAHIVEGPPDEPVIASLVAQAGFGASDEPRLRYPALAEALDRVSRKASMAERSIHTPRIGTGESGGHWDLVRDQLDRSFVRRGINVTVYRLATS